MLRTLSIVEVAQVSGGLGLLDSNDDDGGGDGGYDGDIVVFAPAEGGGGGGSGPTPTYTDSNGDIVVTGQRPPMVNLGGQTYAQFYSDNIAVLYQATSSGFLGLGTTYAKEGNFTYTQKVDGPTNNASVGFTGDVPTGTVSMSSGQTTWNFTPTAKP